MTIPEHEQGGGTGSFAAIGRHPLHPMLVGLPIGLFAGALAADIGFAATEEAGWAQASFWLIVGALLTGLAAAVAGIAEFTGVKAARRLRAAWLHGLGNAGALVLAAINLILRWDDPVAAVVPAGLTISAVIVLMIAVTGWLGGEMTYRHGIGVARRIERP